MALNRRMIAYGNPAEIYTPNILSQLYGGKLATWEEDQQIMVFVDDHDCH
jgi:ABC-type cobalamin/Fe3+-siderophores transport system ATPase subunit